MARYRKVATRIWNDEAFMALSDDGQLAFLFILTHPQMTSLGAMRATVPGLAAEKRWPVAKFRRAVDECIDLGMVEFDERASFLSMPQFLKHNQPESANVVKSWPSILDLLPECDSRRRTIERVADLVEGLPVGLKVGLSEAFRKAFAIPYPDPELLPESSSRTLRAKPRLHAQSPIPDPLTAEPFPAAWQDFRDYRAHERRVPMTAEAERRMLVKLEPFGPVVAAEALRESMVNEWQGVFPERVTVRRQPRGRGREVDAQLDDWAKETA